jgi:hypothetical protein
MSIGFKNPCKWRNRKEEVEESNNNFFKTVLKKPPKLICIQSTFDDTKLVNSKVHKDE